MHSYGLKRGPLLLILVICMIFVGSGISIMFSSALGSGRVLIGLIAVLFFGAGALMMLRRLRLGNDALSFSADGLQSKLNFDGMLPWNKITDIHALKILGSEYLSVSIDRDFARQMKWRFGLRSSDFSIALRQIDGPGDEIATHIRSLWNGTPKRVEPFPPFATARATFALTALLIIIFIGELIYQHGFTIDERTMVVFGGDLPYRVTENGEVWRMFTAPLLHASVFHIGFNALTLLWAGSVVERIAGWKWMLGTFALAALAGEAASITLLDPEIVGVGASGGITGLIACGLVAAGRLPMEHAIRLRYWGWQILIPALLPAFLGGSGNVNFAAHIGGAIVGAALGFALLKTGPLKFNTVMAAAALIFFAVAAYAIYPITHTASQF